MLLTCAYHIHLHFHIVPQQPKVFPAKGAECQDRAHVHGFNRCDEPRASMYLVQTGVKDSGYFVQNCKMIHELNFAFASWTT
jgi:hypothetical protein